MTEWASKGQTSSYKRLTPKSVVSNKKVYTVGSVRSLDAKKKLFFKLHFSIHTWEGLVQGVMD